MLFVALPQPVEYNRNKVKVLCQLLKSRQGCIPIQFSLFRSTWRGDLLYRSPIQLRLQRSEQLRLQRLDLQSRRIIRRTLLDVFIVRELLGNAQPRRWIHAVSKYRLPQQQRLEMRVGLRVIHATAFRSVRTSPAIEVPSAIRKEMNRRHGLRWVARQSSVRDAASPSRNLAPKRREKRVEKLTGNLALDPRLAKI